ncbi:alginate lyase family protein [Emcibacter sp.]|uniref:alginate lyase family protein n=1 Tax=Emcibacter sp. TaxID=1979954 RepID=UPI003A8FAC61
MAIDKIATLWKLGPLNLLRVALYRIRVKAGWYRRTMPAGQAIAGPFFHKAVLPDDLEISQVTVNEQGFPAFGWKIIEYRDIPNWHRSILTDKSLQSNKLHWCDINDVEEQVGDIKGIWELSRFDWVVKLAKLARVTSDPIWLERLNEWLADWSRNNPVNTGVNWKCGQEASIRVMHLALAAVLLDQDKKPTDPLLTLMDQHLRRIAPTLQYAVGQDNNHGTSEAAGLFIGGSFLEFCGEGKNAKKWSRMGRRWLENRAARLIADDGSFSMYSVNYHRVVLDTLSLAEVWRRKLDLPAFSESFYEKCRKATLWLHAFTDCRTGEVPNIGTNDGARITPMSESDSRDFRPSVQLAAALFCTARAYAEKGIYDEPLRLLGIPRFEQSLAHSDLNIFRSGGFAIVKSGENMSCFRFPNFDFRPSQCDALHLDLFVRGVNALRDGGTYRYVCEEKWKRYFQGTVSHNTVQFDERDQMPRLSPFLFGRWLRGQFEVQKSSNSFSAAYKDWCGAKHHRTVTHMANGIKVSDEVSSFRDKAVLRWRLAPGDWKMQDRSVTNGEITLEVTADHPVESFRIVEGWESRYYSRKEQLPVLEVTIRKDSSIITEITWC